MKDKIKSQNIILTLILFLFSLTIGYALLNQNISLNGTTSIPSNSWNIHFVPTTYQEITGSVTGNVSYADNNTKLTFNNTLSIPGDFYEFTIDVINDGGIDGMLDVTPTLSIVDNKGTDTTSDDIEYTNTNIITSSVTYFDGLPLSQYEELKVGESIKIKVRVEFRKDINNSNLQNLPLHLTYIFNPTYVQADNNSKRADVAINTSTDCNNNTLSSTVPSNLKGLARIIANQAYLDNSKSEFVNSCDGVDFSNNSSNTNGNGVYEIASTKDDTYPIYYYRGAVTNNNVLFANFCWKIVRTTDTGGVKLIYNGNPTNGTCTNTTGDATQIQASAFNTSFNSPAYVGYMNGTIYTYSSKTSSELNVSYIYGNDATWNGTNYKLTTTMTGTGTWENDYNTLNNNHYTCFTTGDTCTSVYYIYYTNTTSAYYMELSNGKKVEEEIEEMLTNITNSTAKTKIDTWYSNNMTSYTNKIEDTIYCNDRSIESLNGWDKNGGDITRYLIFSGYNRITTYTPTLTCTRNIDKFTVSNTIGNGKLTYPVGLLTVDEVMYAGGRRNNDTFYLYTNNELWTMTPSYFYRDCAIEINMGSLGYIGHNNVYSSHGGLRPVISLASTNVVSEGDGTANNPYVIN